MLSLSDLTQSLSRLASPTTLRQTWNVLRHAPGGGVMMGRLLGRLAPYTGTIRPEIVTLEPGYVKVRMEDRRRVRNHLSSVHAIALMNLGEVATGVAMMFVLPDGMRGIITHLEMDYVKKARGPITAECHVPMPLPTPGERRDCDLQATLTNASGEVVARASARWRVGA
jgi:acyl-coenzyme A thioesterase PaaI-like protein